MSRLKKCIAHFFSALRHFFSVVSFFYIFVYYLILFTSKCDEKSPQKVIIRNDRDRSLSGCYALVVIRTLSFCRDEEKNQPLMVWTHLRSFIHRIIVVELIRKCIKNMCTHFVRVTSDIKLNFQHFHVQQLTRSHFNFNAHLLCRAKYWNWHSISEFMTTINHRVALAPKSSAYRILLVHTILVRAQNSK